MTTQSATWLLVADARSARIFSFTDAKLPWTLHETIAGDGSGTPAQTADLGPKASAHKGALHGHAETSPKEDDERRFASTLAHVLEKGHGEKAFAHLVLVAPPKMLGDLRANLNRPLQGAILSELNKDYTHSDVHELMKLIGPTLKA